jgi:hypothetical protein
VPGAPPLREIRHHQGIYVDSALLTVETKRMGNAVTGPVCECPELRERIYAPRARPAPLRGRRTPPLVATHAGSSPEWSAASALADALVMIRFGSLWS